MTKTPHQLITHVDWFCRDGSLRIAYDYPFSQPPLPEQAILVPAGDIPSDIRTSLDHLRVAARERCKVAPVRLPHQEILPAVQENILTLPTRDRSRSLPFMRLTYSELVEGLPRFDKEIKMESSDFAPEDREAWDKLRQWVNARAWDHYKTKTKMDGRLDDEDASRK